MAVWISPSFQIDLPLNILLVSFCLASVIQYMDALLHIILHSVVVSYKATSNHTFQSKR